MLASTSHTAFQAQGRIQRRLKQLKVLQDDNFVVREKFWLPKENVFLRKGEETFQMRVAN